MNLEAKEIRAMLAPFYSNACMDEQVDMKEMASLLEYMRESFEKNYVYEVWSNIRLDRSRYDKEPFPEYLGELRHIFFTQVADRVIAEIRKVCRWDIQKGFEAWSIEYAHALSWLRDYIYEALCKTDFKFTDEQQEKVNQYRQLNDFILDSKWPEAFPYFVELAENKLFNNLVRSNLKVITGEIQLLWQPNYHDAISFFEDAKRIYPENARAERGLGEYYARIGEYEKAKDHFLTAISMRPNDIDNYIGMGNTFLNEGNTEAAEKWYKDGINVNFLDYYSYSRIINLYNSPDRIEGKEEMIENYIVKVSQFEANSLSANNLYNFYRDVGLTFSGAKKFDKAIRYYESAIELKPELTAAKIDLGYTYCNAKKFADAEKHFNSALKSDEKWNFDVHWAFAWLYEQIGNDETGEQKEEAFQKAIERYLKCAAIREDWTDRCHNLIGILYYKLGQYQKAIDHYEKAISINPAEVVYYTNKRDALERSHASPEQVERVLIQTCEVMPQSAEHHNRLGVFYHDRGEYERAIPHYSKAIEINPNYELYYENRGLAYINLAEYEKGEADYLKACAINPTTNIYNKLGVLYYRWGHFQKAIEYYSKAIEMYDKDPLYFENLGLAHEKLNDDKRAIEAYQRAIQLEKEKGTYLNRMGLFYYNRADDAKAVEYYQKAIEKEPDNKTYLQNLALAYEQLYRDDEAEKIYQKLVDSNSEQYYAASRLAVVKMRRGIYDETVYNLLLSALNKYPDNLQILESMGHYLEKTNRQNEALEVYQRALSIDPDHEYFNNRAGIILYNSATPGDLEKAVIHYKKAIDKNPKAAVYWQNLGLAYEKMDQLSEAEDAYLESIRLDPKNDEYLNFLGVFYNNKIFNYQKAIDYYKQAAALNPRQIYYSNIGYAYDLLNERKLADEAYDKAKTLASAEGLKSNIK